MLLPLVFVLTCVARFDDAVGVRPAVPFAEGADGMGSKEIGGMLLLCLSRVQRSEYW